MQISSITNGPDGEPSISNIILLIGLGLPLVVWTVSLVLVVLGKLEWKTISDQMEWIKDFVVVVVLPYIGKKMSGMFKDDGIAPDGLGD